MQQVYRKKLSKNYYKNIYCMIIKNGVRQEIVELFLRQRVRIDGRKPTETSH